MRQQTITREPIALFLHRWRRLHLLMAFAILAVCSSIEAWGQPPSGVSVSVQLAQNQFGCAAELYITNARTDVLSIRITPPIPTMTTLVTSVASGYSALPIGPSIEFYRAPISKYPSLTAFKLAAISPMGGGVFPLYKVDFLNAQGVSVAQTEIRPDCFPDSIKACSTNRLNIIVRDITFHKSWMDYFVKEITSSMIP